MSQIVELMGGRSLSHPLPLGLGGGAKMYVGGQAASKTAASSALTNSITETALDSYAIPADSLKAGSTIRVQAMSIVTAVTSSPDLQFFLSLGPTTTALASREEIITTTDAEVAVSDVFYVDAVIQVRTIGSSGTAVAMCEYQDPDAVGTQAKRTIKASFALNTTVEQTFAVSAQWSAASASNSCRSDVFCVDIVNPGV